MRDGVSESILGPTPDRSADGVSAGARERLLPEAVYEELAETFRALADPTRAKIVHALVATPLCVSDLARLVGVSEPATSQHLRLLRARRIVRGRRAGKLVYYSLEDDHVRELLEIGLGHSTELLARPTLGSAEPAAAIATSPAGAATGPEDARSVAE